MRTTFHTNSTFRLRKQCRYVDNDEGCQRGTGCEYLHDVKKVVKGKEVDGVKEIETNEVLKGTVEKECSDLEWKEYWEKVESEIDLKDLLEDLLDKFFLEYTKGFK